MTFPFLWTNKGKLNTSQNDNVHTHLQSITPRVNLFSCSLSWNCFVFDRRSAWAGLMLLSTGSHSQQRCSITTKGVKIKQWKGHACCYCIIALLSSIHLCSGYSFNLTHSANYTRWLDLLKLCIIVIQTSIQQSTTKDLILFPIFLLLFRLILFTTTLVNGKRKSPP